MKKKLAKFVNNKILLDPRKAYEIADQAGLHETVLSRLRRGIDLVRDPNDPRIIRLAGVLNIPLDEMLE